MTPVYAIETCDGWVLQIADDSRDVLAGPVAAESEIKKLAKEFELEIISTQVLSFNTTLLVEKRQPGDLFRIGGDWYRMRHRGSKGYVLDVIGTGTEIVMPGDTAISEISVLSKR